MSMPEESLLPFPMLARQRITFKKIIINFINVIINGNRKSKKKALFLFFFVFAFIFIYSAHAIVFADNKLGNLSKSKCISDLQRAINEAESSGRIFLCSGEYIANLEINKSMEIIGENGVIIKAKDKSMAVISIKNTSNVLISNLVLCCSGFAGIEIISSENITVENNLIKDNYYGISIHDSSKLKLRNNTLANNSFGFVLRGNKRKNFDNEIEDNEIDGKKLYYLKNASNIKIGREAASIYCIDCRNITIENATLERNAYGIFFFNVNSSKIKNCRLRKNNDYGIYMLYSYYNIVENCEMSFNGAYGAYVESSFNNTFSENVFKANFLDGISLYLSERNILIANEIKENRYGLTLVYLANNNKIINNTIKNSMLQNLYAYRSTENFFSGNIFELSGATDSFKVAGKRIFLIANRIDKALSEELLNLLRAKSYNVFVFNSSYFDEVKEENEIIILGGPDAYEGVGEIVRQLISIEEQRRIREKGAKKVFELRDKFADGQRILIFAGENRELTREAWLENMDKI